jgi:hypothetical protein
MVMRHRVPYAREIMIPILLLPKVPKISVLFTALWTVNSACARYSIHQISAGAGNKQIHDGVICPCNQIWETSYDYTYI